MNKSFLFRAFILHLGTVGVWVLYTGFGVRDRAILGFLARVTFSRGHKSNTGHLGARVGAINAGKYDSLVSGFFLPCVINEPFRMVVRVWLVVKIGARVKIAPNF